MADSSIPVGLPEDEIARAQTAGLSRLMRRRSTIAFLLCLPLILLLVGLVVYPALYAIYLSLLNKRMTRFVGLGNFEFLLHRSTFHLVIFQSCLFAITSVIAKAVIGFTIAHLMHNLPSKNQRIWRGLLLVPWVIPLAISTLGWWWLFDPSYSAFNWILSGLGVPTVAWLGNAGWARFCMILVNTWYGTPFFMIMYLAALKSVPEHLYESVNKIVATKPGEMPLISIKRLRDRIILSRSGKRLLNTSDRLVFKKYKNPAAKRGSQFQRPWR